MSLKLFAGGDYVNFTGNEEWLGQKLKDVINSADIAMLNLEAPLNTPNMKPIRKAGPLLYQNENAVQQLKISGINCVSVANNHIYDYGQIALENTLDNLRENNINFIGGGKTYHEAYTPYIYEKEDVSIGIFGACENEFGCLYEETDKGGYAWIFSSYLEDKIIEIKSKVTYVVLMAHAGLEDIDFPIVEWRQRYKRLCDLGVDIVIGHHPHVPQGWEKYNNSLIFYSLGNFYFDTAHFKNSTDDSYSVLIEFFNDSFRFDVFYHKKIQLTVEISEDVNFRLQDLNNLLDVDYSLRNSKVCQDTFNNYYYNYYLNALDLPNNEANILQKFKKFIKRNFLKSQMDEVNRGLLLLHNIRIDTHRFVVQRALSHLYED